MPLISGRCFSRSTQKLTFRVERSEYTCAVAAGYADYGGAPWPAKFVYGKGAKARGCMNLLYLGRHFIQVTSLQINKQEYKCLLALILIQNVFFLFRGIEIIWFNLTIHKIVTCNRDLWKKTSPLRSLSWRTPFWICFRQMLKPLRNLKSNLVRQFRVNRTRW